MNPCLSIPRHALATLAALLAAACLAPQALGQRARDVPPAAPPPAVTRETAVRTGGTVAIPLAIHGSRGAQLEFVVRSNPKLGVLSPVKMTGMNTGTITYTAGAKPGTDRFTYAARTSEGVSAPAMVSITISEPVMLPARLEIAGELKFEDTVAGASRSADIEIKNTGGEPAEGAVKVPPPWRIVDAAEFRVAGGAAARVRIAFEPIKGGPFAGEAEISTTPPRIVALTGIALDPLTISPAKLELLATPGSQTRRGTFTITNRTTEKRTVQIGHDNRLIAPGTVEIAAEKSAEVPVVAEAAERSAFDAKLTLESDGWREEFPVHIAATPAVLRIARLTPPASATAGSPAEISVIVENSGGTPAQITVTTTPPLEAPGSALSVPAGTSTELRLRAPTPRAGPLSSSVTIEGAGQKLSQPVAFNVAPRPQPTPSTPLAPAEESPPAPAPSISHTSVTASEHPNGRGKRGRPTSPTTAVIEWPVDFGATSGFALKRRILATAPGGDLTESWGDGPPASFSTHDKTVRADITRLDPGTLHTLRVVGGDGSPVLTVSFSTPPKKPPFTIHWQAAALLLLTTTLAVLGWRWWKQRARSAW